MARKEKSEQQLMDDYKKEYLKKLIKEMGRPAAIKYFKEEEEAGMFNKGGSAKKKNKKVPVIAISVGTAEIKKDPSKKAKMMQGGTANNKPHMYSGGGAVTDKLKRK